MLDDTMKKALADLTTEAKEVDVADILYLIELGTNEEFIKNGELDRYVNGVIELDMNFEKELVKSSTGLLKAGNLVTKEVYEKGSEIRDNMLKDLKEVGEIRSKHTDDFFRTQLKALKGSEDEMLESTEVRMEQFSTDYTRGTEKIMSDLREEEAENYGDIRLQFSNLQGDYETEYETCSNFYTGAFTGLVTTFGDVLDAVTIRVREAQEESAKVLSNDSGSPLESVEVKH